MFHEYRTVLISAAVTGKIDVRALAICSHIYRQAGEFVLSNCAHRRCLSDRHDALSDQGRVQILGQEPGHRKAGLRPKPDQVALEHGRLWNMVDEGRGAGSLQLERRAIS